MKGEIIQNIYTPISNHEWVLIKTNQGLYSMRLGGFRKDDSKPKKTDSHTELELEFKDRRIQEIYSDDEWVYLILSEGTVIASGWVNISITGEMKLGVKFSTLADYDSGFFESVFFSKLILGSDNWSIKA